MTDKTYQLLMQKGPTPGQIYSVGAILITIGRDPLADIVISDPEVSRQHARLVETEAGYEIQDLGSTNGTFIDGRRLGGEAERLQPGQRIEMGSGVAFLFQEASTGESVAATMVDASNEPLETELPNEHADSLPEPPAYETPWIPPTEQVDQIEWSEPSVEQPFVEERPTAPPNQPPPPLEPSTGSDSPRRRTVMMTIGIAVLLFACCCSFTLFMWFIGGDWLLTQFGILP